MECVSELLAAGHEYAALADIDNFFDSIDRYRLFGFLKESVWEPEVLRLLEIYLHMGTTRSEAWVERERGIVQGSPLSPLLSNVYLRKFDASLEGAGVEWVRYADNFVLLSREQEPVRTAMAAAEQFLLRELDLKLNEGDPYATHAGGFVFLGFEFRAGKRTMAETKFEQKSAALLELVARLGGDPAALVEALREKVLGWRRYYKGPGTREQMEALEKQMAAALQPWLAKARAAPGTESQSEWRRLLDRLELPVDADPARKRRWVLQLLTAARKPRAAAAVSTETRRAVETRKREYRERRLDLEEILITRPGTSLGRTGDRLSVRRDGKKELEAPLTIVRHISLLTAAVSISADLMQVAAGHGIGIDLLGADGRPTVHIGAPESPLFHVTMAQARLAAMPDGLTLARIIVAGKISNQENLLRYFAKYRERRGAARYLPEMRQAIESMEKFRARALETRLEPGETVDAGRGRLFAMEGQAAASYWAAVKSLLLWGPGFEGRERKGARDLVNCLLNYGYGILYSRAMRALVRVG